MAAQEIPIPREPPAEIQALIDTALGAFNDKNFTLFDSTFGGDVVIVDGFAPFRWLGPNAQGRWWGDAEKWAKGLDVLNDHISSQGIVHWQEVGSGFQIGYRAFDRFGQHLGV